MEGMTPGWMREWTRSLSAGGHGGAAAAADTQVPSGASPSDRWKVEDVNTWVGLETLALLCAA